MKKLDIIYVISWIMMLIIVTLIGYNIFNKKEPFIDRHIREIKYDEAQKHEDNNSLILKKLEENDGCENTFYNEVYRQEDGLAAEGRQEAGQEKR